MTIDNSIIDRGLASSHRDQERRIHSRNSLITRDFSELASLPSATPPFLLSHIDWAFTIPCRTIPTSSPLQTAIPDRA